MTRRLLASLALAVLVAACGADDSATSGPDGEPTPMTLMLNWTPNGQHAGIYVAAHRGWYAAAGLDLDIVEPGAGGVAQAVAAGRADIGVSVAEQVLPARVAGVPIVSIATVLPHNDSSLMASPASGIARPRDLAGSTYGGYGGALEAELISRLVACDGGDPDAVEMVDIGNADYLAGMQRGLFDAVWVFGGWDVLRARQVAGVDVTEIRFDEHLDCIPDWYTPVLVAAESSIDEHPAQLAAFLAATRRGYEAAIADPTAAADDLTAMVPEADRRLMTLSIEYYASRFADPAVGPWGTQQAQVWSAFTDFAVDSGLLAEPTDPYAAFTNDLLP